MYMPDSIGHPLCSLCIDLLFLDDGLQDWSKCYWCWKWQDGMYIVDWIERPLCGTCIDRLCQGEGPPWWPDSRTRLEIVLMRRLPANPARLIAEYAREDWEP